MLSPYLSRLEASLRCELTDPRATDYLHHLHAHDERLADFPTWDAVLQFMCSRAGAPEQKNTILLTMLSRPRREFADTESAVLLLIFMPALRRIARRARKWDGDGPEEMLANLVESFLQAARWLRYSGRRENLAAALRGQTFHLLYECYERHWKIQEQELQPEDAEEGIDASLEKLLGAAEDPQFAEIEARQALSACIAGLESLKCRGVINPADFHLMVGALLYEGPLKRYAREHGLSPEACKKRHQRALEKISLFRKKSGRSVSPSDPLGGLFLDED